MDLRKTTVAKEPSGELRVEIAIGDMLDTDDARMGIRFAVVVPSMGENPGLSTIQIAALNRARDELGVCIQSLAPKASVD
jgi:hypothetical protein